MTEQVVRLIYPPSLINVPVINQLIRSFDVTVNIMRAHITPEEGWLEIQVTGETGIVQEAFHWLETQGIEVHSG
jgi:ABC-type methionine transport system ATPase subunit